MRSQISNIDQAPGYSEQKKSVFDRLGCQVDSGRSMKRRPSPGQHGEWIPPLPVHEMEFARYGREPHPQSEIEWRYQNERRHVPPLFPRDRHPIQLAPPPPPQSHYELEMANRQTPYYSHPQHMFHNGPPGPPHPMGMMNISMNMHQQKSSPKYDRHGNIIMNFKDRPGPMRIGPIEQYHGLSPPRTFMPGPMMGMPPGSSHEMITGRSNAIYPPHRWHGTPEGDFPPHPNARLLAEERYSPLGSRRQHHQQQQQQMQQSQPAAILPGQVSELPRYTKWRERRDVITTLDRETAQSSSRTNSLKFSLQQTENKTSSRSETINLEQAKGNTTLPSLKSSTNSTRKEVAQDERKLSDTLDTHIDPSTTTNSRSETTIKTEPQDISDGEIVDDEDSSDDSEVVKTSSKKTDSIARPLNFSSQPKNLQIPYTRPRESHQYYEQGKKRRIYERDEFSMDYETISDEDLDIFMGDKKDTDVSSVDTKLENRLGDDEEKSLSEIELLNALGLDWANLVEMAKQSKTSNKDAYTSGSAMTQMSLQNYLPTLGISSDLVGNEIYEMILKVSRT